MTRLHDHSRYPARDSQRQKLYNAERAVKWGEFTTVGGYLGNQLLDVEEADAWTRRVARWALDQSRSNVSPNGLSINWHNGMSGGASAGSWGVMQFSKPARKPWVILHEMAHVCHPGFAPGADGDNRPHGWQFCDHYLALVQHFMGVEAAKALRTSMKAHKVRYRPKRKQSAPSNGGNLPIKPKATEVFVAALKRDQDFYPSLYDWQSDEDIVVARRKSARVAAWVYEGPDGTVKNQVDSHPGYSRAQWYDTGSSYRSDNRRVWTEMVSIAHDPEAVLWRTTPEALEKALKDRGIPSRCFDIIEVGRERVDLKDAA